MIKYWSFNLESLKKSNLEWVDGNTRVTVTEETLKLGDRKQFIPW